MRERPNMQEENEKRAIRERELNRRIEEERQRVRQRKLEREKVHTGIGGILNIKVSLWVMIVISLLLSAAVGGSVLIRERTKLGSRENYEQAMKFLEIKSTLDKYYVGDVNDEQVNTSAFYSMVKALGDKWSYYMTPPEYENYKLYTANQYAGIGVIIEKDEATKGFRIVAVTPGSPAEASGVVVGDIMLKVEGEDVSELDTDGVRDLITARLDDSIMVTMQRLDGTVKEMQINCRLINIVPVRFEMLEKKTGYVKISNFEQGSAKATKEAVEKLLAEGAVCFVFDVRDNPGGLLSELTELLDYILPEGDIFVSVDKENREQVTKSDNICIDVPMVVLMNENSYSAAEFFAAALSEYGWARTVGVKTTGKGRSQITVELSDGSAVHLSSRKYLTPKRADLSILGGLNPDVPVERGLDPEIDEQLDRAIHEAQLELALR